MASRVRCVQERGSISVPGDQNSEDSDPEVRPHWFINHSGFGYPRWFVHGQVFACRWTGSSVYEGHVFGCRIGVMPDRVVGCSLVAFSGVVLGFYFLSPLVEMRTWFL